MISFTMTPLAERHMAQHGYDCEEMLGDVPVFLSPSDAADAVSQIDAAYRPIGGGWRDTRGFTLDEESGTLTYPGDRPRYLIATAQLRAERILFFDGAWIVVVQPDGAFRAARID